jgi:hypothetical protein
VVRQQVGYGRYDTQEELACLAELYGHLRLYVNFFQPQMKLVAKTREGARVHKRYDSARTPYRRVLAADVGDAVKEELTRIYLELNPVELQRAIGRCQDRLLEIGRTKPARGKEVHSPPDHPFRETISLKECWRTFPVRQPGDPSRTS